MAEFYSDLEKSIRTGFLDSDEVSTVQYQPDFILNDRQKNTKVLSYILQRLEVCDRFWLSGAFLTTSGLACLHNSLKSFGVSGKGKGKIFISDYLHFTQPEALRRIRQFENIETRLLMGGKFHGKGYVFKIGDRFDCLIGSSNLTSDALTQNNELNIHLTAFNDSKVVKEFLGNFDNNFNKATSLREEVIENYAAEFAFRKNSFEKSITFNEENLIVEDEVEIDSLSEIKEAYRSTSNEIEQNEIIEKKVSNHKSYREPSFSPNLLQQEATANLESLRQKGEGRALVISATATGKTFLSAFDVQQVKAKKVLFVVHRFRIASKARDTFKMVFGKTRSYGFYSGHHRDTSSDFIFSTIQTINSDEHLNNFQPDTFDYIIIDETHRAGAHSYNKILDYFKPKFLLGMTATPERTDGFDIYSLFNHNVACEIRLPRAMEEELVCPFHYFGITDISVDGVEIEEKSDFNKLISHQRINHILETLDEYGTDDGIRRGLIFCSRVEEAQILSEKFNLRGYRTVALSGISSEKERGDAMRRIEIDEGPDKIDYIFSVDILNEGIDIPSVNQVVMLRPTESAIIFVQQLGRGLRKEKNKEYLTVIDFIGNYEKNYLIPVALFGDRSLDKDTLRKLVASGSSLIPGTSTVNFDEISKEKIFASIDASNLRTKKDLVSDYSLLRFRLGRKPMMMDFLEAESREPYQFVSYSKSFYNFSILEESEEALPRLPDFEKTLLEKFSRLINNGVRAAESFLLLKLIEDKYFSLEDFSKSYQQELSISINDETINAALNVLRFKFNKERRLNKEVIVSEIFGYEIVNESKGFLSLGSSLTRALDNSIFKQYLLDITRYSLAVYKKRLAESEYVDGFFRYKKYRRIDVLRVLNWSEEVNPQIVAGYRPRNDEKNCPIFVTYKKSDKISDTTKYEDAFISSEIFSHISKNSRKMSSPEVILWKNQKSNNVRLPLFVKKSDDEGDEHYYIGDLKYLEGSANETLMPLAGSKSVSAVNCRYNIDKPVEESLYKYLVN